MKLIPLTQDKFAQVDDCDYEFLMQWKWFARKKRNQFYAARGSVYMHRLLMNNPKGFIVDHKDRNTLNNQKNNLRLATDAQNKANTSSRPNSTSRYLGVHWNKANKKWKVEINKNGKNIFIGRFSCEIDAAIAYNEAAKKIHGEFANLNVI